MRSSISRHHAQAKADLQAEAFFVASSLRLSPCWARGEAVGGTQDNVPDAGVIDAYVQHIAEQVTVNGGCAGILRRQ